MTSAKARPAAGGDQPSALQVAAARLVIAADRKLGDKTPEWIERVAHGLPRAPSPKGPRGDRPSRLSVPGW